MLQKLKHIHFMFYVATIFLLFPLIGVVADHYTPWMILWTALFALAYFFILLSPSSLYQWIAWMGMMIYIFYSTVFLDIFFLWFLLYLSNLAIFHFHEEHLLSPHLLSVFSLQVPIILNCYLRFGPSSEEMGTLYILLLAINGMTIGYQRIQLHEAFKKAKLRQNAQLNLFLAENERNRIGRDLHDSLGHTFAMLSLKSELAQHYLQRGDQSQLAKELAEIHHISKQSMADTRRIIDNLKHRTLDEEITNIQTLLEMMGLKVTINQQLNIASLPAHLQVALSMMLLELATNIIKHAQAHHCQLDLYHEEETLVIEIADDGIGFQQLTGQELHSIRERLATLGGQLDIKRPRKGSHIRLVLPLSNQGGLL